MASGYVGEREKFTKRKNKGPAEQFMSNFEEFTDCTKSIIKSFEHKTKTADSVVKELIDLREVFDSQQDLLLNEISNEVGLSDESNERIGTFLWIPW